MQEFCLSKDYCAVSGRLLLRNPSLTGIVPRMNQPRVYLHWGGSQNSNLFLFLISKLGVYDFGVDTRWLPFQLCWFCAMWRLHLELWFTSWLLSSKPRRVVWRLYGTESYPFISKYCFMKPWLSGFWKSLLYGWVENMCLQGQCNPKLFMKSKLGNIEIGISAP